MLQFAWSGSGSGSATAGGRHTAPGPSAIVTHSVPVGQGEPSGHATSQLENSGPDGPAMPKYFAQLMPFGHWPSAVQGAPSCDTSIVSGGSSGGSCGGFDLPPQAARETANARARTGRAIHMAGDSTTMPAMSRRALAVLAVALAVLGAGARPAAAGDPEREWRTIESTHFAIHYYEPLGDVAQRVAAVAEHAHRVLAPVLGHAPRDKTHIVIIDDNDGANGFASVLPRNHVTLYASAPNAGSVLADHDDWLYALFAHEYTHILHLDSIGGLARWYNAIFGKIWAPNQIMPRWIIEGLATYEESKRTSGGRTRAAQFDMFLRVPVLRHQEMRLDELTGAPLKFPRGNAPYLYGSHFLKYVFDRFGDDTARRMSWAGGSAVVPFGINRQLHAVIGETFDGLDDDWRRHLRDRATLQQEAVERHRPRAGRRLTVIGEFARNPRYTPDGRELYWTESDGLHRERILAMPVGGDRRDARQVVALDRLGTFDVDAEGGLVYEQTQFHRDVYAFQDLLHRDGVTGRTTRLTTAARARDPALSPDGDHVAYSRNGKSTSALWVLDRRTAGPGRAVWQGDGRFDQVFAPAWSPDGARVAFVAWRTGGERDILVQPVAGGPAIEITADRALDDNPRWSPDGRWLYFTSDRTGIANVFAHDLATGATWQVTNVIGGVAELAVSPDSTRLAYFDFVGTGWDLHELAIDPAQWTPARPYVDDRPDAVGVRDDVAGGVTAPRPYRPAETLAPQTWTAQLAVGSFGQAVSAQTSGADVAGLHGYQLATTVELERGDVNVGGSYGYGGFRPGVRVGFGRTIAHRNSFRVDGRNLPWDEEVLSASGGLGIPVRRTDTAAFSIGFDYAVDWVRSVDRPSTTVDPQHPLPGIPRSDFRNAGFGVRASYGNVRGYLYNVGPTEGMEASIGMRVDHPALGATHRALSFGWFWRTYHKLPYGATPALMVRVAGSTRVSDLSRGGGYGVGGMPVQDVVQAIIDSTRVGNTGFLRGYPQRVQSGNTYHLVNVEYRHELATIERGASTLPFYVRRLHAAVLADAGTAYDEDFDVEEIKPSIGAALRLDTHLGYFMPGSFELGVARGLADGGQTDTWLYLTGTL